MAETISVLKYLVGAGFGSRRACASIIMKGEVKSNGQIVTSLKHMVSLHDSIEVRGNPVKNQLSQNVYLILNKPKGFLSTVRDDRGRPTVLDLIPPAYKVAGLVPAGRLDYLSSGLIIMTNDGDLINRITHPKFGIEKEYLVNLSQPLYQSDLNKLLKGFLIESGFVKALGVKVINKTKNLYSIVIAEGRNREIRLMMDQLGKTVHDLKRIRIGEIVLGKTPPMKTVPLTDKQIRSLQADLNDTQSKTREIKQQRF